MSVPRRIDLPQGATRRDIPLGDYPVAAVGISPEVAAGHVLLIPGFTGSKEDFLGLLEPLAVGGYATTAIDLPGQWHSDGPQDEDSYTIAALAEAIRGVVDHLVQSTGMVPHVVGHSMGGLVVRSAVLDYEVRPASITLLASGPARVPTAQQSLLQAVRAALPAMSMEALWNAKQILDESAGAEQPPPDVLAFLRARWIATSPYAMRAMATALLVEPDRTEALRDMIDRHRLPTLVVWGTADDVWHPATNAVMAERLGAQAAAIPDAGHSPAVDAPQELANILLRFWERGAGGFPLDQRGIPRACS